MEWDRVVQNPTENLNNRRKILGFQLYRGINCIDIKSLMTTLYPALFGVLRMYSTENSTYSR